MTDCSQLSIWASKVVFPRFQVLIAGRTLVMNFRALPNNNDRYNNPSFPSWVFYWATSTPIPRRRR